MHSFQDPQAETALARNEANRWLSRFAPLLQTDEMIDPGQCDTALATIEKLRADANATLSNINRLGSVSDQALISTLQSAIGQLDSVEDSVRRRLALVQPGDPDGRVDLQALQAKLAVRAAQEEVAPNAVGGVPSQLTVELAEPSPGTAFFMFLFGTGWNAFTFFHMLAMVGGMWHAFGAVALLLVFFYLLFFAVGIGMWYAALDALSVQTADFDGLTVTLSKRIGSWARRKVFNIKPGSNAFVLRSMDDDSRGYVAVYRSSGQRGSSQREAITLTDVRGRNFSLPSPQNPALCDKAVQRINLYLATQQPTD